MPHKRKTVNGVVWHWPLNARLLAKGYDVIAEFHCRGFDTFGPLWLMGGINRRHPDDRDLERAAALAREALFLSHRS